MKIALLEMYKVQDIMVDILFLFDLSVYVLLFPNFPDDEFLYELNLVIDQWYVQVLQAKQIINKLES